MPWYRLGNPGEDTIAHLRLAKNRSVAPCKSPRFANDDPKLGEICGRMSAALCDHPGCDIPICEYHRVKHPTKPNTDFCPDHKEDALRDAARVTKDISRAMREAGISASIIYAFQRTGHVITKENASVTQEELAEWNAAIAEYERLRILGTPIPDFVPEWPHG